MAEFNLGENMSKQSSLKKKKKKRKLAHNMFILKSLFIISIPKLIGTQELHTDS